MGETVENKRQPDRRLFLEALEERIAPAGNVVVVVSSGGNMTITGDAEGNDIVIERTDVNQFRISSGDDPTTINGNPEWYADNVTGNVKASLGDGSDAIQIHDASFAKNLSIDHGKGDGETGVGENVNIAGKLMISAKDGSQDVSVLDVHVGGKTTINLKGVGEADVHMGGTFDSDVKIQLPADLSAWDVVEVNDASFVDNLQIVGGKGILRVELNSMEIGGDIRVQNQHGFVSMSVNESTVHGGLQVLQGVAKESSVILELLDSTVLGPVAVKAGQGWSKFLATRTELGGSIKLQYLSGVSEVSFNSCYVGAGFPDAHPHDVFVKSTWGLESFQVLDSIFEARNVTLKYDGYVTVQINGANIEKNFSLQNSKGEVWAGLFDCDVMGKTAIRTGSGQDSIYIDGVHLYGALSIATGKGDDLVSLETQSTPGATSIFDGKVAISTGDDNDDIFVGQGGVPGNNAVFNSAVLFNGGRGDEDYLNYILSGNTFAVDPEIKDFETII